eukprot:87976-Chlamydomonas_euryale.AAC.5
MTLTSLGMHLTSHRMHLRMHLPGIRSSTRLACMQAALALRASVHPRSRKTAHGVPLGIHWVCAAARGSCSTAALLQQV